MHPLLAGRKQLAPRLSQLCSLAHVADEFQDVPALEITALGDAVRGHECLSFLAQQVADFSRSPDEELALLALAVGVLGGVEATSRVGHLSRDVIEGLFGNGAIERLAGHLPGVQVDAGQLRVVVQHLLKMRRQPVVVNGVAVESATELIVHAPAGHGLQGLGYHLERQGIARGVVIAQQKLQRHRLGELRRVAPPAVSPVKALPEVLEGSV